MAALAPTVVSFARAAHSTRSRQRVASRRVARPLQSRVVPRGAATPGWLTADSSSADLPGDAVSKDAPLRVLVAGGGLGGLFAAICLRNAGADVAVIERTATYRPFGGPIQLASNGVSTIKATSESLFRRVTDVSRPFWRTTSGIRDGLKGNWMFTFGAITELPDEGNLPFSICVDRSDLQEVLLEEINQDSSGIVSMGSAIAKYENRNDGKGVDVTLEDGRVVTADVLVGADGIWSNVRAAMTGTPARGEEAGVSYSGYTVFAGELNYNFQSTPSDIGPDPACGYKVYIGPQQYFVITDIGRGRYQWCVSARRRRRAPTAGT